MANGPDSPPDDGNIGLPRVDSGMNKIAPGADRKDDRDGPKKDAPKKRSKKEDDAAILTKARKRFDRCVSRDAENRKRALSNLKFIDGRQWDDADLKARTGRPTLTINKLKTFVNQVANGQRENRPAINISPVGDRADKQVAEMFKGVIRFIERACSADIAYDTGYWNACANGFGYWRITTDYDSPDSFDQIIEIKRIRNPFTVYLDPSCQEPDGADAKFGFVTEMMDRSDFKDQYPGADPLPFEGQNAGETYKEWIASDQLRIAEYFDVQFVKRDLVQLSNGWTGWEDKLSDDVNAKIASGELEVINRRESEVPKIRWYKLTAKEILERNDWVGQWIPIVRVIGNEIDIEGKVSLSGVVADAIDPQKMYNYWSSAETESIAQAPKSPWIMEEGQIEGHEDAWDQANTRNTPYLLYRARTIDDGGGQAQLVPPPQRVAPAPPPVGIQQAKVAVSQDMMATTGIRFDASPHERVNDESGRALREIRRATDIGTYHFIDNQTRGLHHTGRILIDLIPKVMDTRRILTILREDGSEEAVMLDPHAAQPVSEKNHPSKAGKKIRVINPTFGRYGVTVTTGPSYATRRVEASQSMMDFVRALPQVAGSVVDLIAKNQDWPDADQFAARLAKTLPPHLLTPDIKDVPPQVQALVGSMQNQIQKLMAERLVMMRKMTDQSADRAQRQDKINKDFEAKLLGIMQKAQASNDQKVGAQIDQWAQEVRQFMEALSDHVSTLLPPADAPAAPNPMPSPTAAPANAEVMS